MQVDCDVSEQNMWVGLTDFSKALITVQKFCQPRDASCPCNFVCTFQAWTFICTHVSKCTLVSLKGRFCSLVILPNTDKKMFGPTSFLGSCRLCNYSVKPQFLKSATSNSLRHLLYNLSKPHVKHSATSDMKKSLIMSLKVKMAANWYRKQHKSPPVTQSSG